jgi:hypothetical protein
MVSIVTRWWVYFTGNLDRSSEILRIELSLVHMIQQAVYVARVEARIVTTANPELHR